MTMRVVSWSCVLLLLLLITLAQLAVAVAADVGNSSSSSVDTACRCNNGLVLHTQPRCACLCFDQYLLPSCLYRASDVVPMQLTMRRNSNSNSDSDSDNNDDGSSCHFAGGDVVRLLAWAFDSDTTLFAYQYGEVVTDNDDDHGGNKGSGNDKATAGTSSDRAYTAQTTVAPPVVRAVVTMPGWAAQHLLADAVQGNLHNYNLPVPVATTATATATTPSSWRVCYTLTAVREAQLAPPQPRPYTNVWLRMYAGNNRWPHTWYIGVDKLAWLIGAVLLVLGLVVMEQWTLYNVDYNIGGGVVHVWNTARSAMPPRGVSAYAASVGGRLAHARASMRGTFSRMRRPDEQLLPAGGGRGAVAAGGGGRGRPQHALSPGARQQPRRVLTADEYHRLMLQHQQQQRQQQVQSGGGGASSAATPSPHIRSPARMT